MNFTISLQVYKLYVVGVAMAEKIQGLEVDYPHVCLVCFSCGDKSRLKQYVKLALDYNSVATIY